MNDDTGLRQLDRPNRLPEQVTDVIRTQICNGGWAAGERLPTENDLASRFGVSRGVVREAISQLKYDGLVETRQGSGAFVGSADGLLAFRISKECFAKRKELLKIIELFKAVESEAAALAAIHKTNEHLERMRNHLYLMTSTLSNGPNAVEEWLQAEHDFRMTIAAASDNKYFQEFIKFLLVRVQNNMHSVVVKNTIAVEFGEHSLKEYELIYRGILNEDPDAAHTAVINHFKQASDRLEARKDLVDY